jgi:proteasome lid subunit RPN8/RPN11
MFIITERQYNIIMQQAQACYPQESGGFLGGRGNTIRTETFALADTDIDTAYRFLIKHKLEYLGVYHSHPRGIPYPSEQDLAHHQKYLFIVGLQDRYNPDLYAWRVENGKVVQEDIKVVSDYGVTVIDIKTGQPKLSEGSNHNQLDRLAEMIDQMVDGKSPVYPKLDPTKWDAGSFSTLA